MYVYGDEEKKIPWKCSVCQVSALYTYAPTSMYIYYRQYPTFLFYTKSFLLFIFVFLLCSKCIGKLYSFINIYASTIFSPKVIQCSYIRIYDMIYDGFCLFCLFGVKPSQFSIYQCVCNLQAIYKYKKQ